MPLDSVVVLPHRTRVTLNDIWSELTADRVARLLARDERLRVIPPDRVPGPDGERSVEEIARELHVTAAAICSVDAVPPSLDLRIELVDVLAESTIAQQTFLSSTPSALRLHVQAARAIAQWMMNAEPQIAGGRGRR